MLEDAEWQSLSIPDVRNKAVGDALGKLGWDKKGAAAAVSLRLSPDNSKPEGARLVLLGEWDKKISMQAKKVFAEAAENIIMKVEVDDIGVFRCRDNDMWSNYIPQEAMRVWYMRDRKSVV